MNRSLTGPGIRLIVGMCLIMASFYALSFIVTHAGHDCCGEGCPVCLQIRWTLNFFRQLRYVPLRPGFPRGPTAIKTPILKGPVFIPPSVTAVTLKVKISA